MNTTVTIKDHPAHSENYIWNCTDSIS